MTEIKKLLLIFNPNAGAGRLKNRMVEILCRFSDAGYEMQVFPTAATGDARRIAQEYGAGQDLVVCCGGDGTLNEVVNGLLGHQPLPTLGYIPCGTTNDFASSLSIPKSNIMAAVDRILRPKKLFQCDVGWLNDRAFAYVAAFGAFTNVSYKTPQSTKNMLGYFAYLLEAVQQLPSLHSHHATLTCNGKVFEDDYLFGIIANSASVAGFTFPNKEAVRMDDGAFEMLLVRQPHNLAELGAVSAALLRGDTSSPLIEIERLTQVDFSAAEPCAWTVDGEFGGKTATAQISVQHQAINICI